MRSCGWEDAIPSPSPNFCFQKKGKEEQCGQKQQSFTTTLAPKGAVVSASSSSPNPRCYHLAVVTGPSPTQELFFDLRSSFSPLSIWHTSQWKKLVFIMHILEKPRPLKQFWTCIDPGILNGQDAAVLESYYIRADVGAASSATKSSSLSISVKLPLSILRRWAFDYSQFAQLPIIPHPVTIDFFLCWSR